MVLNTLQSSKSEANEPLAGTSIWIPIYLKEILDSEKLHPREPYYQVIERVFGVKANGNFR